MLLTGFCIVPLMGGWTVPTLPPRPASPTAADGVSGGRFWTRAFDNRGLNRVTRCGVG